MVGVVAFFQIAVLRQPFPNLAEMVLGLVLILVGLTLFVRGLEMGLFPLGESMAWDLSLIHISEPTRPVGISRMPSSA